MEAIIANIRSNALKLLLLPIAVVLGVVIAKVGLIGAIGIIGVTVLIFLCRYLYFTPKGGIFIALLIAFFVNGITRYLTGAPLGLLVDFILVLTLLVAIFSQVEPNWKQLRSLVFWVTVAWFGFTVLEIVNPEARSKVAWFYAVRAVSLYQIFVLIIGLLYINKATDVYRFTNLCIVIIALSALWAARQLYSGLDTAEWAWLNEGAYKTHILKGVLRAFSFYSDAGQYGATSAYGGLVALILAFGPFKMHTRVWFIILALLGFWGMLMSGTRGALFVPAAGIFGYLVAIRNFKAIAAGLVIAGGVYFFLAHTTIANDNQQVRRLRTALDPNDPSLQVRLENQKKFKSYLASRPIGGGIGTSGSWGQRFSPGTFLAETPNDSWYVKIWAETGVVGLTLHIAMLVFYILYGFYAIFRTKDPKMQTYLTALQAGYIGIAVASYGNPILGQFPLGIILYGTWVFFVVGPDLAKQQPLASTLKTNT